jgi:hypothetical protein|uniref:Uncharacterized protein n=1 Tax=Myoviridae sp. ctPuP5 TaxID=2823543 RepID=A0A8S5LAC3_9CAUD|nr:MAG TPA: hypothetical protein [Myoviridae sp. ctPuP5]
MASTFTIYQYGKPKPIEPKWTLVNNMSNPPYCLQSFRFFFNNTKTILIQGGGGLCYGSERNGYINGIASASDFPLTITSYDYQLDKTSGMNYSVNISPYTYTDYQQGRTLEITINSYV